MFWYFRQAVVMYKGRTCEVGYLISVRACVHVLFDLAVCSNWWLHVGFFLK